jgi:hypothetical protein
MRQHCNEPSGRRLGEKTLKPCGDLSVQFCFLLVVIDGVVYHKEEIECMPWCHTKCSGAENGMFYVDSANDMIRNIIGMCVSFETILNSIKE